MRHLVIGTDGTWNRPDQMDRGRQVPSNVVRIVRAVDEHCRSVEQIKYYDTGVGTGGWLDHLIGGAFGLGLLRNVCEAWRWLIDHYRPGDRIFLFGFSRGAYTARSLAGLLGLCGIPPADGKDIDAIVRKGVRVSRTRNRKRRQHLADAFRATHGAWPGDVHFLGVWDTVGALGLPKAGPLGWWSRWRQGFHDVSLGRHVRHAFHALAIHERRRPFRPTLWRGAKPDGVQRVAQCWFPGVHSNVGGGYVDAGLADRALWWMICRAQDAGLQFNAPYIRQRIDPNWFGELRDSMSCFFRLMIPVDRRIGTGALGECLHFSAVERWSSPTAPEPMPANVRAALAAGMPVCQDPHGGERNFHEPTARSPTPPTDRATNGT
ncbi:MAG: DUF2235 domain-containing protein [Alphaproteobacteria bacterium]|nr:MAG: DUF2235 domain-containing protein [Alphaproteobacteria bacterium]